MTSQAAILVPHVKCLPELVCRGEELSVRVSLDDSPARESITVELGEAVEGGEAIPLMVIEIRAGQTEVVAIPIDESFVAGWHYVSASVAGSGIYQVCPFVVETRRPTEIASIRSALNARADAATAHAMGRAQEARGLLERAAIEFRAGGAMYPAANTLVDLATVAEGMSDRTAARRALDEAISLYEREGDLKARGCAASYRDELSEDRSAAPVKTAVPKLFVVLPLHNEAAKISAFAMNLNQSLRRVDGTKHTIILDYFSSDDTFNIVSKLPNVDRAYTLSRCRSRVGWTSAFLDGIRVASEKGATDNDVVLFFSAAYEPSRIVEIYRRVVQGYDVILGQPPDRGHVAAAWRSRPWWRLLSWFVRLNLRLGRGSYFDPFSPVRAYRWKLLRDFVDTHKDPASMTADVVLNAFAGRQHVDVGVVEVPQSAAEVPAVGLEPSTADFVNILGKVLASRERSPSAHSSR